MKCLENESNILPPEDCLLFFIHLGDPESCYVYTPCSRRIDSTEQLEQG